MAHRNIKITRDIVQTCNKLHVFSKSDLSSLSLHKPAELSENAPKNIAKSNFHYMTNNENECSNFIQNNTNVISPFSYSTKPTIHNGSILGIKSLEVIANRSISNTSQPVTASRSYSSKKKDSEKDCKPVEKKCFKNLPCPRFVLADCPPAKVSDCKKQYVEHSCTKKMAPYPSYSELCAYRMEDHPSECQQCPWQKCGGVDDIKPQKKNYHTSARVMNMAMIPTKNNDLASLLLQKQCDASKEPCKEPPPKCKKREVKKEKCPEKKEDSKKKCRGEMPREAYIISGSMKNLDLQRYKYSKNQIDRLKAKFGLPSNLAEEIVYDLKDCPTDETKCPKRNINPPVVDHTIDDEFLMMSKEHDKGHPPPCEEKKSPKSDYCPENVDKKKIYRRERDLYDPAYRRYPVPMTDPESK